jgi:hypothetical protein
MNLLLAHHIEAQHVPVLLALLVSGFFVGWSVMGRVTARRAEGEREV